jgi:hypothetical protein
MAEVEEVVEEDTAGDTPITVRTPNNRQPKTIKSKNSRFLIMTNHRAKRCSHFHRKDETGYSSCADPKNQHTSNP